MAAFYLIVEIYRVNMKTFPKTVPHIQHNILLSVVHTMKDLKVQFMSKFWLNTSFINLTKICPKQITFNGNSIIP